ncbi:MAG: ATP synthase F1 subunit gamma [Patescibacteria group bacterium]
MAVNTKAIKRRIKSVGNTKKITKAMEMVAASKMRKATEAALKTREYAQTAWNLLVTLAKMEKASSQPLLEIRPVKKLLLVLITSNRGLCGSFNSNIIRKTIAQLANPKNISRHRIGSSHLEPLEDLKVDVIGVGKKGVNFVKKMGYTMIAAFTEISDTPRFNDLQTLSKMVIDSYANKEYDKVVVAYTNYKSSLVQEPKLRQILPVSAMDLEKMIGELDKRATGDAGRVMVEEEKKKENLMEYLFEPSRGEVLNIILPRLVESQVYQSVLESAASEHSARMMAMRNASDAADDMIKELNLSFNKARQAGITQEISEIVGGTAALE